MFNGPNLAIWGFLAIIAILLAFAFVILWKIVKNEISLAYLISEPVAPGLPHEPPKASLSRFQFLIFTFVIAGLFLLLSIEAGTFVEVPTNVLGLLGISGGSFVISKAIGTPSDPARAVAADNASKAASQSTPNAGNPPGPNP
jgi:hypothetical protein